MDFNLERAQERHAIFGQFWAWLENAFRMRLSKKNAHLIADVSGLILMNWRYSACPGSCLAESHHVALLIDEGFPALQKTRTVDATR